MNRTTVNTAARLLCRLIWLETHAETHGVLNWGWVAYPFKPRARVRV